jgi:hypothetical protein
MEAVIGVDPHNYVRTAVALDGRGGGDREVEAG